MIHVLDTTAACAKARNPAVNVSHCSGTSPSSSVDCQRRRASSPMSDAVAWRMRTAGCMVKHRTAEALHAPTSGVEVLEGCCAASDRPRSLDCARKLAPLGMTGGRSERGPLGMTGGADEGVRALLSLP